MRLEQTEYKQFTNQRSVLTFDTLEVARIDINILENEAAGELKESA